MPISVPIISSGQIFLGNHCWSRLAAWGLIKYSLKISLFMDNFEGLWAHIHSTSSSLWVISRSCKIYMLMAQMSPNGSVGWQTERTPCSQCLHLGLDSSLGLVKFSTVETILKSSELQLIHFLMSTLLPSQNCCRNQEKNEYESNPNNVEL